MDELKITKGFMSGVVSRLINKMLYAKYGCVAHINVEGVSVNVVDGITHFHLDICGELENSELNKLLKGAGI